MIRNQRMTVTIAILIGMLILLGCAGSRLSWGDAESGYTMTYRFSPRETLKYETRTEQHITMEMAGNAIEVDVQYAIVYSMQQSGVEESGNAILTVTIDGMEGNIAGMQGLNAIDAESLVGKHFRIELTPRGEIVEFLDTDTLPKVNLGPMAGGEQPVSYFFNSAFPILPERPVKSTDEWTTQSDDTEPDSLTQTIVISETTSRLIGPESDATPGRLNVETRSQGTIDRASERMGMNIRFEADMERESAWVFDYLQGRLVTSTGENIIEGAVAMTGQMTQTMPMIIEGSTQTKWLEE